MNPTDHEADHGTRHVAVVNAVIERGRRRELHDGEELCRLNDETDTAFAVISGGLAASLADDIVLAVHGPGAVVGEIRALVGGLRTANLRAVGPTCVSEVGRDELTSILHDVGTETAQAFIGQARDRSDRNRVARLLADRLDVADKSAIPELAARMTWHYLEAGEVLFRRGDRGDAAYLVVSGILSVLDADDHVIARIGRGDIVGEFGLLEERARTATVRADRDVLLARLSSEEFQTLAAHHTVLALGLVRHIIERAAPGARRHHSVRVIAVADLCTADPIAPLLSQELQRFGPTAWLDMDEVDRILDHPGLADAAHGEFGEVRVAELLHEIEQTNEHFLLDVGGRSGDRWRRRAVRSADVVVALLPPNPSPAQRAAVTDLRRHLAVGVPLWVAIEHPSGTRQPVGSHALGASLAADRVLHLRGRTAGEIARLARLVGGRGVGLALSGGGGRGFAHLGVLETLDELGVPVDAVVGTSMGAVIAAITAKGGSGAQRMEEVEQNAAKALDYTLPIVSMLSGTQIAKRLNTSFGSWNIEDLWLPFACVSTSLTRSARVEHRSGGLAEAVRASISLPGVLPPVPFGRELLVDGGVLDNLPVGILHEDPAIGTIIASDVAPPVGPSAHNDFGHSLSGWKVMAGRLRRRQQKYPGLATTLLRSTMIGSCSQRDHSVAAGYIDCYLSLDLRPYGLLDFANAKQIAARGRELAAPPLTEWATAHWSR